jgi:hypothetical protein
MGLLTHQLPGPGPARLLANSPKSKPGSRASVLALCPTQLDWPGPALGSKATAGSTLATTIIVAMTSATVTSKSMRLIVCVS